MISHKYKCIFIHIPRTGGSSIEKWMVGYNWFKHYPSTKHIFASQAKEIYKDYWDDYFKFSFVRNPWDRMVSCIKMKGFFKVKVNKNNIIDLSGYKKQFGYPLTIENDYRFYNRGKVLDNNKHIENCVYGNFLDEELDFVGKYENLKEDIAFIKDKLGIKTPFKEHASKSPKRKPYNKYYNENVKKEVENIYYHDIVNYNYEF